MVTAAFSAVNVRSRNLRIQKAPNWICIGEVSYGENISVFSLAASGSFRGLAGLRISPLLTLNCPITAVSTWQSEAMAPM
jgi:hypothetical protein